MLDVYMKGYLVPIYGNIGGVQECRNYRGYKLMSHMMNVWEKVI